jgi:hypothetical protein
MENPEHKQHQEWYGLALRYGVVVFAYTLLTVLFTYPTLRNLSNALCRVSKARRRAGANRPKLTVGTGAT